MTRMSIRNKLYVAFGMMILLLVTISVAINVMGRNLAITHKEVIDNLNFESEVKTFQKQHADWLNALSDHIFTGSKFDKHLDPKECGFGKWYYDYIESNDFRNNDPEIKRLIKELEEPHRHLHEGGAKAISEMKNGRRTSAIKFYQENTIPTIAKLDSTYTELAKIFRLKVDKYSAEAGNNQRSQNILGIVITILGALLGLAITYFLSRDVIGIVRNVFGISENVANAADQIAAGSQELSQRTQEQASAIEETVATVEQMTVTVKQNAENAVIAKGMAKDAVLVAQEGGQVVDETIRSMGEVSESSKKIADIIRVVNEIAFQTNLLALNAAVEAARAGEQGKGFAVVAGEVRSLAQRSAEAAKEIQVLIQDSVERVAKGSNLVEESGKTLRGIIASIQQVADTVSEISAASLEQASGIDQVNRAVSVMDEVVQMNASLIQESAAASQTLASEAEEMRRLVSSISGADLSSHPSMNRKKYRRNSAKVGSIVRFEPKETGKIKAKAAGAENLSMGMQDGFEDF